MADNSSPAADTPLPEVQIEARLGLARPTTYTVTEVDFLVGTVPGCDLRLPGASLPPVLCLIARRPHGVGLRKLAPTQSLTVNGKAVTATTLDDGDRILIGGAELIVHAQEGAAVVAMPSAEDDNGRQERQHERTALHEEAARLQQQRARVDELAAELDGRRKEMAEQATELETNRVYWYQRRDEVERECQQKLQALQEAQGRLAEREQAALPLDLRQRQQAAAHKEAELGKLQSSLEAKAADLDQQRQELAGMRQELADIRRQLYERYQERRDRLSGLQEAVNRAAQKVQERKHHLEAEAQQVRQREQALAARAVELDGRAAEVAQARQQVEAEQHTGEQRWREREQQVAARLAESQACEERLEADRRALEEGQKQHQADLVRLDRLRGALEQRDKEAQARAADLERRVEEMQKNSRDMEEQVVQLDEWHTKLSAMAEQLNSQKAEQDGANTRLAQRAAAVESQQAMLAGLRARLERMRDEVRAQDQQVTEERGRLEIAASELERRVQEAEKLRADLDNERAVREQERRQHVERSATLEAAVTQMRQAQEKLAGEEDRLLRLGLDLEARGAEQAEAASLVEARTAQCEELQRRLEAERQALRERAQLLAQAEQAREALQEQLRRRSEELAGRQKAVAEQIRKHEEATATLDARRAEVETQRRQAEEEKAALHREIEQRALALTQQDEGLQQRTERLSRDLERLKETGRAIGAERKAMLEERARLEKQQQDVAQAAERARSDFEAARREAISLQRQLPELELRAGTAFERLSHAREQLREQIAEVHTYAGQCQEDLDALRSQVQAEEERLQQHELALRRSQDEHRLAVAAFRQQLIDWQGQVGEVKRMLAHDETRLQQRQAIVDEQARSVDAEASRLAKQAEQLQQHEQVVEGQRAGMKQHLVDMRDWYRRKLRELAGIADPDDDREVEERSPPASGRDILSLTGNVDPADRQLGDLMRALDLVDADTLTALLVEARRQRRSLRQVLLASGTVTLYQLALIEAGNVDALMLGPVRVVDRLRVTARETVYRVFDPRRGREAVLRHLAETEMQDAVHPDEFRQRFAQAMLPHPNLAATWEVLEVGGRPAALQEWLTGLPSSDWPSLAAAPGVWYRLVSQTALALHTAHEAGLAHGHLDPVHVLLTGEGIVKVCGFGEPPWLVGVSGSAGEDPSADLLVLGRMAAGWCGLGERRKAGKNKALPDGLQAIFDRLVNEEGDGRYPGAGPLLDDLDRAGTEVPANAEAWDRLIKHVREHAVPEAGLRQTA